MRILYVWDADYPWDVRTEKVCLALVHSGHEVVIAARNLSGAPQQSAMSEGLVERLPLLPWWARRPLTFPAFFNPLWIWHLVRLRRKHRIDLVMARDLPLAPTALLAAGHDRPVILDMAENYPAMISDIWRDGRTKPFDWLVRNPRLVRAVERYVLRRVSHTITVVEESRERVIALGVPADRVSIVSNTPSRLRITKGPARRPGAALRIVYLGLMERHRGIGDLIDAARQLQASGVEFSLDLIGDGRDLDSFRAQAGVAGGRAGPIAFHGRLPHARALRILEGAHVGVVPHHATEAWSTTISNKLFDYMAAGLAVVTSDAAPSARVVKTTGAGLIFRSGDAHDLAAKLEALQDISLWERCRAAGKTAIRHSHNWEADSRRLLDVIDRVGASQRTTAA